MFYVPWIRLMTDIFYEVGGGKRGFDEFLITIFNKKYLIVHRLVTFIA